MDRPLGNTFRELRKSSGFSAARIAALAYVSEPYIRQIENGTRPMTFAVAEAYDRVLEKGGLLVDLYTADKGGDDVRRRTVLACLATVAGTGVPAADLLSELLRTDLLASLGQPDWMETADDLGQRFTTDAPDVMRLRLSRDLMVLRHALAEEQSAARLAAPRLMLLYGMLLGNAGQLEDARAWYRAARVAAEDLPDEGLRHRVRGRETFRLGYEGARPETVLALAEGVRDVEAHLAAGQAYARLNQPSRALEALERAQRLYDRAEDDSQSIFEMPEWRMILSSAYVHALLGDTATTESLLDQVQPPPVVARWQSQRDMQRAVAYARARDVGTGMTIAETVFEQAPAEEQSAVLSEMCSEVRRCATTS